MKRWRRRLLAAVTVALAAAGAASFGQGAWILAKAELAQVLLERSWERARNGEERPVPWPWADTWPVARLRVPRLGEEVLVLEGATGAVLAFGPGHLAGTAEPGEVGNVVIAGHRDTHFELLQRLAAGDELVLETADGGARRYRVEGYEVVRQDDARLLEAPGDVLTLVTCYPFGSVFPSEERYVVRAVAVKGGIVGAG